MTIGFYMRKRKMLSFLLYQRKKLMILFFQNGVVENNFVIDLLNKKNWNKIQEIYFS
jgi:hypothetical protein